MSTCSECQCGCDAAENVKAVEAVEAKPAPDMARVWTESEKAAFLMGKEVAKREAAEQDGVAYEDGYEDGYEAAGVDFDIGYAEGVEASEDGLSDAFKEGFEAGSCERYEEGFEDGYDQALEDCTAKPDPKPYIITKVAMYVTAAAAPVCKPTNPPRKCHKRRA